MEDDPNNLATLSPAAEAYLGVTPFGNHRTRLHLCSRHRSGELNHVEELATPADKAIVAPTTTRYTPQDGMTFGTAILSSCAHGQNYRYWNVMIADAYSHVTISLGDITAPVPESPSDSTQYAASRLGHAGRDG